MIPCTPLMVVGPPPTDFPLPIRAASDGVPSGTLPPAKTKQKNMLDIYHMAGGTK